MVVGVRKISFFFLVRWRLYSIANVLVFFVRESLVNESMFFVYNYMVGSNLVFFMYKTLIFSLKFLVRSFKVGYFLCFFLSGVYFRIRYYKRSRVLCFLLGFSRYVCICLPKQLGLSLYSRKRRVILFGFDRQLLMAFVARLFSFKRFDVYRGKGFRLFAGDFFPKKLLKKR